MKNCYPETHVTVLYASSFPSFLLHRWPWPSFTLFSFVYAYVWQLSHIYICTKSPLFISQLHCSSGIDTCFGLICVSFKSLVGSIPFLSHSAIHSGLVVFNHLSYVYRLLLPVPFWTPYFADRTALSSITIYFALSTYMIIKVGLLAIALKAVVVSFRQACTGDPPYGVRVPLNTAPDADNMCAVCHETLNSPVQLQCKHVFCEECIGRWLEREHTCPMCRAKIENSSAQARVAAPLVLAF